MSLLWLMFASLTVVGGLAYNVGVKMGTAQMNAFGFTFLMSVVLVVTQALVCLTARYAFKVEIMQGVNPHTLKFALLTGLGAALIDTSYFFALRHGSVISSQIFWTVGGMVAVTIFSLLFFNETMSLTRALGVALGAIAVFLISK